jgi:hypothetical protein
LITLFFAATTFADTVFLRNGQQVQGTYLGGTARQIKMAVGDQVQNIDVTDVVSMTFGGGGEALAAPPADAAAPPPASEPAPPPPPAPPEPPAAVQQNAAPQQPAPPAATGMELPAGTNLVVRMIDAIDSRTNKVGQTFNASIDAPVTLADGTAAIPRGADVVVKLVDDKESGKLAGKTILTLSLVSVRVNGRMVDVNTQNFSQASSSRTGKTAKMAGGGAALGAIIGGLAGGGKGAAIGAGAGAGAGAGVQVLTKGQQVKIPSETRLTFVLDAPVKL